LLFVAQKPLFWGFLFLTVHFPLFHFPKFWNNSYSCSILLYELGAKIGNETRSLCYDTLGALVWILFLKHKMRFSYNCVAKIDDFGQNNQKSKFLGLFFY